MLNRRTLLGSLAALFGGAGTLLADSVKKVYLTIHSDKKDSQYGIENGSIEIHDSDSGKMRKISVRDGRVSGNDEIVKVKLANGGYLGKPNKNGDIFPVEYEVMTFKGIMPKGHYIQGDYVTVPTHQNLSMKQICELRGVKFDMGDGFKMKADFK